MSVNQYLSKGYQISPFYKNTNIEEYKKIKKVEINNKDLKDLLLKGYDYVKEMFYDENKLVIIKFLSNYKITIDDASFLIKKIIEDEYIEENDLAALNLLLELKKKEKYIYSPNVNNFDKNIRKDYLFDDDNHLVLFVLEELLYHVENEEEPLEELHKIERFIKDILDNREYKKDDRKYSNETIGLLLDEINEISFFELEIDPEILKFYRDNLIKLASLNDPIALRSLGYNYYEGLYDFPLDYSKSLYYLTKYFELTEDMDVTRPIGYIYYYGRNNNGIPQKDKAFQYFVLGHLAGYFESTYKLSDCYLNGYGTIKSYKTAYNLVSSLYYKVYGYYLDEHVSKYPDIALRMGNFYKKGIYVEKDLEKSKKYYLKARCAIKDRLKDNVEYPGDRSVALGIKASLDELNDNNKRIIKYGGYLINSLEKYYGRDSYLIKIDFVKGYLHIYITNKIHKYLMNVIPSLNFAEKAEVIEYLIKIENYDVLEFIDLVNKCPIEAIVVKEHELGVILEGDKENDGAKLTFDEVINVPQTLKTLSNDYMIVSVEFYEGSKLYDYLCDNKNVKINDIVKIKSKDEVKEAKVKDIKFLYEDELPLPLEKMSKIL